MNLEEILQVKKQRGRGNNTLQVFYRDGRQSSVPMTEDNRHYREIQEWEEKGHEILPPDPKTVDPNRGPLAYSPHPNFILPADEETKIWRYMNFPKFVSLLDKNALFFCRGRILRKSDSREGSLPKQNFSRTGAERLVKIYGGIAVDFKENQVDQFLKTHLLIAENMADSVFINCWNASLYENPALWKLYGTEENSVAIQSTVGHLKKCFGPFVDYDILVGKIFYIDYDLEEIDEKNYFNLFLNKRKEFEYENEFRCIFFDDGDNSLIEEDQPYDPFSPNPEGTIKLPGVLVPTSLNILIDKIFVSPTAEDWFLELIKSTLKKYEVGPKEVIRSGL